MSLTSRLAPILLAAAALALSSFGGAIAAEPPLSRRWLVEPRRGRTPRPLPLGGGGRDPHLLLGGRPSAWIPNQEQLRQPSCSRRRGKGVRAMSQSTQPQHHQDPAGPAVKPEEHKQGGGASGPNHHEAGDTRRSDQNNQHKGGADGTGGPGGTGGSVL